MPSDDYKSRIIKAINKYETKNLLSNNTPKRKNNAPEKEVEREVLAMLRRMGCFVNVYDSALQPDSYTGPVRVAARSGTPDLIGCTNNGMFLAVELKAPGCRSKLREHQRQFLINTINNNGFGCVTDNHSHLHKLYSEWLLLNQDQRRELLLNDLPKQSVKVSRNLFDDE